MRGKKKEAPTVRVIRDCRDAGRDYWLSREEASRLYREGRLDWDLTNGCYTEPLKERVIRRVVDGVRAGSIRKPDPF